MNILNIKKVKKSRKQQQNAKANKMLEECMKRIENAKDRAKEMQIVIEEECKSEENFVKWTRQMHWEGLIRLIRDEKFREKLKKGTFMDHR